MPACIFNLEGTFLGFSGEDPRKPKSIVLEVDQEQMAIKLPKEIRAYASTAFKVGDRLRCVGKSQVDFKAGVIKLKAYQVFALPPVNAPATAPLAAASSAIDSSRAAIAQPRDVQSASPSPQRSKILICRKSGCQKRGGRQMVAALERILQAYQLQDQVEIRYTGCTKRCSKAPNLTIMPGKYCYEKINEKDLVALIEEHFCSPDAPNPSL